MKNEWVTKHTHRCPSCDGEILAKVTSEGELFENDNEHVKFNVKPVRLEVHHDCLETRKD